MRRLVVDANIVIAAFLRDSTVRRIITVSVLELSAPEFLWEEIRRHLPVLRRRAGLSGPAARQLLGVLRGYIGALPAEALLPVWERASEAMARIDPRDVPYVAAALAVPCDGIWSDDDHFRAQTVVRAWSTRALVASLRADGVRLSNSG